MKNLSRVFLMTTLAIFVATTSFSAAPKKATDKNTNDDVTTPESTTSFSVMSGMLPATAPRMNRPIANPIRGHQPISGPISVPVAPTVPSTPANVLDAMAAIITQTGAVPSTQSVAKPMLSASRFARKQIIAKTRAQAQAIAEDEYTPNNDPAGFHLVLTGKKYADFYGFQSMETWLRKDYTDGGMFFTLEVFTPRDGTPTFGIQGPVVLGQSNTLGSRVPIYYRGNYSGWGTFSLYVFFVGGDGSMRMDKVTYYCGAAPSSGQVGYHSDTARAHADTTMIDVTGVFPKGIPIYLMMGSTDGAGWGQDPLFSFDGRHLYHRDYATGAYEQGVPRCMYGDGDTEGFVLLFIAEPGNEQHLTLDGIFLQGVPPTVVGKG